MISHKIFQRQIFIAISLSLSIIGTSCFNEKDSNESSSLKQKPNFEVVSKFLSELKKSDYSEVDASVNTPAFRWNFSDNENIHKYEFEQVVHSKSDMGQLSEEDTRESSQDMDANGTLFIKSQADGTAEFILKDMKMNMVIDTGSDAIPKAIDQEMPPTVIQGMSENGLGSSYNDPRDMLLKMIFPLPSKDLKVGESVDVPVQMPFNAMGSILQVKGYSRITLTRYVKIDDRTCAEFDVDIDISDLSIPSELKGEYKCSTKGNSLFYFDIDQRHFVSGVTALLMQFSINAPIPQINSQNEKLSEIPKRAKMSMKNDNLVRVTLVN